MSKLFITIMAAGLGKRMRSELPKVLHKVDGTPMLVRIINQASLLNPDKIFVVIGKYIDIIGDTLELYNVKNVQFVIQKEQLGTGDAIASTLSLFGEDPNSTNIILNGDAPLLSFQTISDIYNNFVKNKYELQITCINTTDPTGNGRILKSSDGTFCRIVEEKDCDAEERAITLVNCGIYVATVGTLIKFIPQIRNENAQHEYYLTDIVGLFLADGLATSEAGPQRKLTEGSSGLGLYQLDQGKQVELSNVNTKEQLDALNELVNNL